jgi:hypothetical protein
MHVLSNYFRLVVFNNFQLGVSNYFQMAVSNYFSRPIKIKDLLSFEAPNYVVILWKYGIRKKLLITQNGKFHIFSQGSKLPVLLYYCLIEKIDCLATVVWQADVGFSNLNFKKKIKNFSFGNFQIIFFKL